MFLSYMDMIPYRLAKCYRRLKELAVSTFRVWVVQDTSNRLSIVMAHAPDDLKLYLRHCYDLKSSHRTEKLICCFLHLESQEIMTAKNLL